MIELKAPLSFPVEDKRYREDWDSPRITQQARALVELTT